MPDAAARSSPAAAGPSTETLVATELSAYTDTDTVTVFTPSASATVQNPAAGWSGTASYLADIVSAASVDIVSTASRRWTEVRNAGTLGATFKPGTTGVSAGAAVSSEPDYLSASGGGRLLLELAERTVNPTLGYSYGHDTAGKTGTPFSVYSQGLDRHAIDGGCELVLDRSTTAHIGLDAVLERGDQKKPYRMLPMFDATVADRVPAGASLALVNQLRLPGRMTERTPLERNRFALSLRLARRFARSTLIVAERVYADDWGLFASTSDAQILADLGTRFVTWLHLRWHVQSGVAFWQRAYVAHVSVDGPATVPEFRTGDRELAPLVSATGGLGVRWNFGARPRPSAWALVVQGDVTATDFLDALYVRSRLAEIGVVHLEMEL
jgi:hypothetical protein